jgi:hypothetical protein
MFEDYRPKILNKLSNCNGFGVGLKLRSFFKDRIFDNFDEGASKPIVKSQRHKKSIKCGSLIVNYVHSIYLFRMIFHNVKLQAILNLAIFVLSKSDTWNRRYERFEKFSSFTVIRTPNILLVANFFNILHCKTSNNS